MTVEKVSTGQGVDNVASMVQILLRKKTILANVFRDVSNFWQPGDKSISFPKSTKELTVQNLAVGQKGDDQDAVLELDKLPIDQRAHIQFVVPEFDQEVSKVEILENAINETLSAHAIYFDEKLFASLILTLNATDVTGGIVQDSIVDAITALDNLDVPDEDRRFVFGRGAYGALLKLTGFVDSSQSNLDLVRRGVIGQLYGIPVFKSSIVADGDGYLTHRDAVSFGFAKNAKTESESAIGYGVGSRRWAVDAHFGTKEMQAGNMAVRITT